MDNIHVRFPIPVYGHTAPTDAEPVTSQPATILPTWEATIYILIVAPP